VVQLFTSAVDEVRRLEGKDSKMPSGTRWAVLKAQESARNSRHSNARLEGLNGLFQAARARARGHRNVANYITMVYLIAAPIQVVVTS
jgi:hypothetical protein